MSDTIRKLWNCMTTVIVLAALLLAFLVVGVRLFGIQPYLVLSGSMEPEIHTGAVVYVRAVDPANLQEGDIITFTLAGDVPVTHRIVAVTEENGQTLYQTKGDANEQADNTLVHPEQILGSPLFSIPYLGFALRYLQQPPGCYVGIALAAAALLLLVLPELLWDDKEKNASDPNLL